MADSTQIEWTDSTWNPVTGCTKITTGCDFCYAERFSERFRGVKGHPFENGFDLTLRPERLEQPLEWRKPRRIFVNSMSDIFHKEVPTEFIDRVFDTMERASWHTYQVLTKRSSLMARFLKRRYGEKEAPPHIWLGVSVEDQKNAVRLNHLKAARASVKFVSFEPLIGPIGPISLKGLDWVIVGGESGPHARPMEEPWAIDLLNQCKKDKVAFFFKQWGGFRPKSGGRLLRGREWSEYPNLTKKNFPPKGGEIERLPGREQTQAKHYVLKKYLQALAFKVLRNVDITYVDGFSGPWESQTDDFSDTSFMIAIQALQDAQKLIETQTGVRRTIRCFFVESDRKTYEKLVSAVVPHHNPEQQFEIETRFGQFEGFVSDIRKAIGRSFPLIFIDPTGWTGYPFPKIKTIFEFPRVEVIINFMHSFVSRFVTSQDPKTIASLEPILGGPGWQERLDPDLPAGHGVEKLFRDTLKAEGKFAHVVSTKIDKSTADRPHFFLAYGTKNRAGLIAFRQTEYDALKQHAVARAAAKSRRKEDKTGVGDLFAGLEDQLHEASIDDIVQEQMVLAKGHIKCMLSIKSINKFADVVDSVLEAFMLRETNVRTICFELANEGVIQRTWGTGNKRPVDDTIIRRM